MNQLSLDDERSLTFFSEKQIPAVLKHGIIRRHLPKLIGKLGSTAHEHRVSVLDAYAGAGSYDDGSPGSPLIAARIAADMEGRHRQVLGFAVEKRRSTCNALRTALSPYVNWSVLEGSIEDHLDTVLSEAEGLPMFALFDPFGLMLPFEQLQKVVIRPKTDILLNFSVSALQRLGGCLTSTKEYAAKASNVDALNRTLGGDWWQAPWRSSRGRLRRELILEGYVNLLNRVGSCASCIVPVARTRFGPPVYYLVFLTHSMHGLWAFNESLSLAQEELRIFWEPEDGVIQLSFDTEVEESEWIAQIRNNVERLLRQVPTVRLLDDMTEIFGTTLGWARGTHLRAALDQLFRESLITTSPKGQELEKFVVTRPAGEIVTPTRASHPKYVHRAAVRLP